MSIELKKEYEQIEECWMCKRTIDEINELFPTKDDGLLFLVILKHIYVLFVKIS